MQDSSVLLFKPLVAKQPVWRCGFPLSFLYRLPFFCASLFSGQEGFI